MADEVAINFIYPPKYDALEDRNGHRRYIIQLTGYSDGTGEIEAVKVRRTDLLAVNGKPPSKLIVEKIEYDITGMMVTLEYSGAGVDDVIAHLNWSSNVLDFGENGRGPIYTDPDDDPEFGNILLTSTTGTADAAAIEELDPPIAGDTYNITLTIRAKE